MEVDHINRNPLDNRRENLRLATRSENQINSWRETGSSGFKGVQKKKGRNKWRADIQKGGIKIFIGCFNTKKDAAKAYNQKAKELFGEYAHLNQV